MRAWPFLAIRGSPRRSPAATPSAVPLCVHWVRDPLAWLAEQRAGGTQVVGVELADEAVRLADLPMARHRTVAVLGHERDGISLEALDLLDLAVEIPWSAPAPASTSR